MGRTPSHRAPACLARLSRAAWRWLLALWVCTGLCALAPAHAAGFAEVDVRAVFLLNFALFVDWPPSAFDSGVGPYQYCALGSSALRSSLESTLASERVGGRSLVLIDATDPGAWQQCHVLYLDSAAQHRRVEVLAAVRGAPVLTVGDSESFALDGGMIGLVRREGRLHAMINRDAAEREGLRISSKLLRLATLVTSVRE